MIVCKRHNLLSVGYDQVPQGFGIVAWLSDMNRFNPTGRMVCTTAVYHSTILDLSQSFTGPRTQQLAKPLRIVQQVLGVADANEAPLNFPPADPLVHVRNIDLIPITFSAFNNHLKNKRSLFSYFDVLAYCWINTANLLVTFKWQLKDQRSRP